MNLWNSCVLVPESFSGASRIHYKKIDAKSDFKDHFVQNRDFEDLTLKIDSKKIPAYLKMYLLLSEPFVFFCSLHAKFIVFIG